MLLRSSKARKTEPAQQSHSFNIDVTALVVKKIRDVGILILFSSVSRGLRANIWPSIITRPSFMLHHAALTFLKDAKEYLTRTVGAKIRIEHKKQRIFAFDTTGPRLRSAMERNHSGYLIQDIDGDDYVLDLKFTVGYTHFTLDLYRDGTDDYLSVFPESGHAEHSATHACIEYEPPHLLAKLVELKLI